MVKSKVSGISTDVVLFSEYGTQLVHHYWVFGDCVTHASLRGSFMIDLLYFTTRACAEARWVAKRSCDSSAGSDVLPDRLGRSHESSPDGTSTADYVAQYRAPQAPMMCPLPSGRRRPSLPVSISLPLPRFATQDVAPDTPQSLPVEIRPCPSSPGSRSLTPYSDLDAVDSECSHAGMSSSPVSDIVLVAPVNLLLLETSWFVTPSSQLLPTSAEVVVESPEFGLDMSTIAFRFSPLRPPVSPTSLEGVDQVVVESPTPYNAPVLLWIYPRSQNNWRLVTLRSRRSHLCRQCNCRPIGCVRILVLALWMYSPCLQCSQKPMDIYPTSPLFRHRTHRLHQL